MAANERTYDEISRARSGQPATVFTYQSPASSAPLNDWLRESERNGPYHNIAAVPRLFYAKDLRMAPPQAPSSTGAKYGGA
jgi:hypothetical protein